MISRLKRNIFSTPLFPQTEWCGRLRVPVPRHHPERDGGLGQQNQLPRRPAAKPPAAQLRGVHAE